MAFAALMAFWLAMSGSFKPLQISLGVISVIIVLFLNHKLQRHRFYEDEVSDWKQLRLGYTIHYLLWLTGQIILSGIQVAAVIIRRDMPIETYVVKFNTHFENAHQRLILGNSITLTPGTLTLDIRGDEFTVHALTYQSLSGILDHSMPNRVSGLFSKKSGNVISDVRIINTPDELS